ncbi:MBL fold metallo-hydrolase [Desulfovirgula thermocuniculi]|uniref:MBL fold metallo-hydrolase n=1 Tax=Desulfovirgula thermocuniculi TaxID=348842 RepID=UPI0003F5F569|nr:MBL fold metallo-hydrolase [Desulfovirgula thermocuniculi]
MGGPVDLGEGIYLIDVHYHGEEERACVYLVRGQKVALVESGHPPGARYILAAMEGLGVERGDVVYVVVTHVHLDHAGAAGVLLREFPRARLLVHPRGVRHMVDPSRLVASARGVYGDRFDSLFGEVIPVPPERVHAPEDGEKLDLGGREFTFYHSPGHARHHMVVHDSLSGGIFAGDALGIRLPEISRLLGRDFVLPSTTPTEFEPAEMLATVDRLASINARRIFFTHFGTAGDVAAVFAQNREMVEAMARLGEEVFTAGGGVAELKEKLWELVSPLIRGVADQDHRAVHHLEAELELNAQGIIYYYGKREKSLQGGR